MTVLGVARRLHVTSAMNRRHRSPDNELLEKLGFRVGQTADEQELFELRRELSRLKAVVEMLADTVQALTARQQKTMIHH
jgi:hypothetical protein